MGLTGRCKERERKRTIRSFILRFSISGHTNLVYG
ncbi:hypothetical protein I3843_01G068300 [Carya illinoinensis]|nr:hypothetical protein I3843_01G068300 [Carya illinoinensis]